MVWESFHYHCFKVLFTAITGFMVYVYRRDGVPEHEVEKVRKVNKDILARTEEAFEELVKREARGATMKR